MNKNELNLNDLKINYFNFFENKKLYDELMGEVLFGFNEINDFISNNKIKSILEVGSGPGILLCELKKIYPNIKMTGLEPLTSGYSRYKNIISQVKEKGKNINELNFVNNKLEDFNTKEKFDLIFSINVLEHVSDWERYIENTKNLLNENGLNVILCPNYDFPYESHYVIPIIINKKITKFLFKKRIDKHDKENNLYNHWENINFVSKKKINNYLKKKNYNFYFDDKIKNRLFDRIATDIELKKKQGLAGNLAIFSKYLYLDKLLFDFLRIPFPFMKIIIKN
tara:strand:- start:30490 stop:31335 length:846 start_codon:yes stop_codon:yes gene_type:complete